MYVWHKYWARKSWNVVGAFVEAYAPRGAIVLDPFAGSGVTGIEAVRRGRRAIVVDLVPLMEEIVWATLVDVDPEDLLRAFRIVESSVRTEIEELYLTTCPICGTSQPSWANVWENGRLARLRYVCTNCGERYEKGADATSADHATLAATATRLDHYWYPTNRLEYPDGQPFLKRERYRSIDELFTSRNLLAFAMLMAAIDSEKNRKLQRLLKAAFTSVVHLGTKMMPVQDPSPTNHHTAFSALGWQQQSYWSAPRAIEKNVWHLFESAILGHQGLIKAKRDSREAFPQPVRFASSLSTFLKGDGDIYVHSGDGNRLMARLPEEGVDYIFTDPPYDVSVQYGELAFLWVTWLRKDRGYLDALVRDEVIRNEKQHKAAVVYQAMLRGSFEGMFKVVRKDAYATVTFHNPSLTVRKATIEAATQAGFDFQKIHHQPTAVRSPKSLLQPFGSAQGDFYLRFYKEPRASRRRSAAETDDARFERVVVDTTVGILAERGEPTPYTFIINKIDPELAQRGFFSSVTTGLDVKTVLQRHLGEEFQLVRASLGGVEGELWWFADGFKIAHPEVPLAERVERAVLNLLRAKGTVDFTQAWEAVSVEFPNSLTPDTTSILDALQTNARKTSSGRWILKEEIRGRETAHNDVIAALADIGKDWGFKVWIGKKEQAAYVGPAISRRKLSDLVDGDLRAFSSQIADLPTAEQLDCVWVSPKGPTACFEVEATTDMTSGLLRGSNLTGVVRRYLVIPEERRGQLLAKRRSPLFAERWDADGWQALHFDHLLQGARTIRRNPGKWDLLEGAVVVAAKEVPRGRQLKLDLD